MTALGVGVTAWLGPVNLSQVKGADLPGVPSINLTCTGDGAPACGQIAESFTDPTGRRLPNLLKAKGAPPTAQAVVAAFSAGGSIAKRLAMSEADRQQIPAMVLSDATYTTTEGAPEGFVRYAVDASTNGSSCLLVATASSSPNKNWPTGAETLMMIKDAVEQRTGRSFVEIAGLAGVAPAPVRTFKLGNVYLADYGSVVSHGEHATKIAPQVFKNILIPWLAWTPGPGPGPGPVLPPPPPRPGHDDEIDKLVNVSHWAAFLAGAVVGAAGAWWLRRRRR